MGNEVDQRILEKIRSFKRKYYLDLALRGAILSLLILVTYIVVAALIEYSLWLDPWARFVAFVSFFAVAGFCLFRFLREPLAWWIARRGLSEEESARIIGRSIPEVDDRLLNFLQLSRESRGNDLAFASLTTRAREFEPLSFDSIIDLRQNTRFAKYLLIPFAIIAVILVFNRAMLTQSTDRLIHFSREYSPAAPFDFVIANNELVGFYNEDFELEVNAIGKAIPQEIFIVSGKQRIKMEKLSAGKFSFVFEKLQRPMTFQLEGAGFFSESHQISLFNRPELNQFQIDLEYPRYLRRAAESLVNVGNIEVPEGTVVTWKLSTAHADSATFKFSTDSLSALAQHVDNQHFIMVKKLFAPTGYEVELANPHSKNTERISYHVDVIKDQHPSIALSNLQDSILYQRVLLGGKVSDDYGLTQLSLFYKVFDDAAKEVASARVPISITSGQNQQSFFYNWSVDSLRLGPGFKVEYYLQVWDNDGVNGRKSTRTGVYSLAIPTKNALMDNIDNSRAKAEKQMDEGVSKARKLQDQIDEATQKIKGKQNLSWEDKKMLEDIIQQKNSLDKVVERLKEENKLLEQKKDAFTQQDERIKQKAEQIQKLMEELLDEETKKLFDELQKLLQENKGTDEIQKLLNKLNQNSSNLEKELERMLELFKDLQYESKFDQALKRLEEQVERQKEILKETEQLEQDSKGRKSQSEKEELAKQSQDLAKEQDQLRKDVEQNQEDFEELEKLGEELHKDDPLPEDKETQEVLDKQEESMERLKESDPGKAKAPQQKSLEKMKQMQQQMQAAQNDAGMQMEMENLESLRQIVHSLVKLSFDQEDLLKQFNELSPNDPRFNIIAQNQLKLKDNSRVLEDSLRALAKRDPFMGSIITREIGELNNHLEKVIEANKERRRPQASAEMQATMTAINNLALMLDDHFDMLMQMMANAKPSAGKQKQKGQKPSLSEMQQKLNERIQQLKNSGKQGQQLSEELAEMAAEQERIRKALQEMEEKMNEGSKPGNNLPGKMEQTEMELVNKQLTDQLIRRQQEILTRLLETEKSAREQDQDEERKGESAKDYEKEIPKAFEEYLRLKEKEVELLKTVPPKLYPYYKKEVNEYFKRMGK